MAERAVLLSGWWSGRSGVAWASPRGAEVGAAAAPDWSVLGGAVVWPERGWRPHGIFGRGRRFVRYAIRPRFLLILFTL